MKRERILASVFIVLIGCLGVFLGLRYLLGFESLNTVSSVGCKAICGLGLLTADFFSEYVAKLLTGLLFLFSGIWSIYWGYSIVRSKKT